MALWTAGGSSNRVSTHPVGFSDTKPKEIGREPAQMASKQDVTLLGLGDPGGLRAGHALRRFVQTI